VALLSRLLVKDAKPYFSPSVLLAASKLSEISNIGKPLVCTNSTGLGIETMFTYVDKMKTISTHDVAQVAKQYLDFSQANSVELIPQGVK
jgi:predicted Zn-dependent peptidase